MTLLNYKEITTDTHVKPSTKCPAYMCYQAIGKVIKATKHSITIDNAIEGTIKFPIRYLSIDKEATLIYKLTKENPYET